MDMAKSAIKGTPSRGAVMLEEALYAAMLVCDIPTVKEMVAAGIRLDSQITTRGGRVRCLALTMAIECENQMPDLVELVLPLDTEGHLVPHYNELLVAAATNLGGDGVSALLKLGANPDGGDEGPPSYTNNPLFAAASYGNAVALKVLLAACQTPKQGVTKEGHSLAALTKFKNAVYAGGHAGSRACHRLCLGALVAESYIPRPPCLIDKRHITSHLIIRRTFGANRDQRYFPLLEKVVAKVNGRAKDATNPESRIVLSMGQALCDLATCGDADSLLQLHRAGASLATPNHEGNTALAIVEGILAKECSPEDRADANACREVILESVRGRAYL
jgi:hypothetical protein